MKCRNIKADGGNASRKKGVRVLGWKEGRGGEGIGVEKKKKKGEREKGGVSEMIEFVFSVCVLFLSIINFYF